MVSRRALFGLSVGAVVAAKAQPVASAPQIVAGEDFGRGPAMAIFSLSRQFPEEFKFNFGEYSPPHDRV